MLMEVKTMNKNFLVIKINTAVKEEQLEKLHKDMCDQVQSGIVLLPAYCELIFQTFMGREEDEKYRHFTYDQCPRA